MLIQIALQNSSEISNGFVIISILETLFLPFGECKYVLHFPCWSDLHTILTSSLSGIKIAPSMNLIGALTKSSQIWISLRALKHNVDFKAEESGNLQ